MKPDEILQALSIFSGVITAVVGVVVWRVKMTGAKELKKIDVSAEWQTQMINRISTVEKQLSAEREKSDALSAEIAKWQQTAAKLEWELQEATEDRERVESKIEELESENTRLHSQNMALAKELREMYKQIRGGHQSLSIPPLPASLAPPPIKKRSGK